MAKSSIPYATATSGHAARDEITRMLRRLGCSDVGFMDKFDEKKVILAFTHRGRAVQLQASAAGWAAMYLRENPWNNRRYGTESAYKQRALDQGLIAVNSILRDWVKGQVMAIECGIMSFNAVFMPHMMTNDGRTMIEVVEEKKLLPAPSDEESAS